MADAFAPQFQGEVRFNQPSEQPSTLEAVADLAGMFTKSFLRAEDQRASTAPKTDPNLGVFRQGLERVEAIRQERGETAALVAERQLASNFAMAGINLDDDFKDVYETTTGRTWAGYGADNEARILQETMNDPQVQASYVASFAVNKDWTEEQRVEYAIGQKATLQAAENEIARSKAEAGYKWGVQTEAAYNSAVDTFLNVNLGALMTTTQQGGRVSPQDIANLTAQWGQLKVNVSRPPGVSDDQWKAIEDKITNVDNMLTTMQKAGSSEVMLETLTTGFANAMIEQGGGSTESLLAGMTALKDPATLTNLMGGKVETFIMGIGQNLNINIPTMDLFGHVVETQGGLAAETDPNAVITSIPENIKQNLDGKTPEQIYKGLEASGMLTSVIGPADLNRPEARQQFVENATTIGAVLMNNPSDQFLSDAALKKLIANPQFIRNILALEATDPEAYTVARQFVRGGLNTELARQQRNLEAIESNLGVTWNGSAYVLDKQALIAGGLTAQQADGFVAWVGKTYGGDLKALADGLAPMPPGMNFKPAGLQQAYDRRAAIGTIGKAMSALEVKVEGEVTATPTTDVATGAAAAVTTQTPETYFDVNDQNLPAGGSIVEVGSAKVVANNTMKPLLNSTVGASSLVKPGADTRIAGVLQGPFQTLQNTFGAALVINDGLAKEGTSREKETPGSRHFHGDALDISTAGMSDADKLRLVDAALAAGFQGFGFGNNILHVDLGSKRAWAYGNDSFGGMSVADLKARVQGNATAPATISMDPRVAQPSAGGNLATPEADDKEGAATGFTLLDGSFSVRGGGATTEAPATATEAATAELPVDFSNAATGVMPQQEEQAQAPVVDAEVAALIEEIAGNPDKTYNSERELLAAQQRGELEPGDTVVVDGVAYMVRKDGTPKRLGVVQQ